MAIKTVPYLSQARSLGLYLAPPPKASEERLKDDLER